MGATESDWMEPIMKRGEKSLLLCCENYIEVLGNLFVCG